MRFAIAITVMSSMAIAQDWTPPKLELGPGPLLFFRTAHESAGQRTDALQVVWPDGGGRVQEVARGRVVLHARVADTKFLLDHVGGLWLVDFASGERRLLSRKCEVLRVDSDQVWVLENQQILALGLSATDSRRKLSERQFEKVHHLDGRGAIAVTAGDAQELRVLSLDGKFDQLGLKLGEEHHHAWFITSEVSPSRKLLGLGLHTKARGYELRIVDLESSQEVMSVGKLSVAVSLLSSSMPEVSFTWLDDQTVRFSETVADDAHEARPLAGHFQFVDLRVPSGQRLAQQRYSDLGLRHQKPPLVIEPPTPRYVLGQFEKEGGQLFARGEDKPLADLRDANGLEVFQSITLAKDGRFAALRLDQPKDKWLDLVDGVTKSRRRLHSGFAYDPVWF